MCKVAVDVGAIAVAALLTLVTLLVLVVSTCTPGGAPGEAVAGFADDQLANAAAIVAAGTELGTPQRAHVIAVATAMQESQLLMYAWPARVKRARSVRSHVTAR